MATAGELHPTEGIRLLLERQSVAQDGLSATYGGAVYTPTASFHYHAALVGDGTVELTLAGAEAAEADVEKRLLTLAKVVARSSETKRADGLKPWPERVMRWRGPKVR